MVQWLNNSMAQLFAVLTLFSRCAYAQTETVNKVVNGVNFNIAVFDYGIGISDAKQTEIDTMSPSLNFFHGTNFTVLQKTNKIKAQKGLEFGINFRVSTSADSDITITTVWVFPQPIFNAHLEKKFKELPRPLEVDNSYNGYAAYKFEQYYEMVKGEWRYQLYYNNELLYSKSFFVE